jgi:hypothetical protein
MEQKLIELLKLNYNLDDFYSITINPDYHDRQITLQGHNTPEKLLKYTQLGYSFGNYHIGFTASNNKITINLTN